MKLILVLVFCLALMPASPVFCVDVNSVCYINSGIGQLKNLVVKYDTIYVERVDLAAVKSGEILYNYETFINLKMVGPYKNLQFLEISNPN